MGLCITDHFECDSQSIDESIQAIKQSLFEAELANTTYGMQVRVTKGIELGQPYAHPDVAEKALSLGKFDFVIGSVHGITDGTDLCLLDFNRPDIVITEVLEDYYKCCVKLAQWNGFDSLAHLGYPERYIWGKCRIPVNIEPYRDLIDEVLNTLIDNGKALEINTSGLRTIGKTIPDMSIVKRYRELGGELITLGSDAHYAEHLAYGFDDTMDQLLKLGFRYFTVYRNREPLMLRIL